MVLAYGMDYAWLQIEPDQMKVARALGVEFVVRYLGGSARLTPEERDNLHAADIAILLTMEQEADQAEKGYARGVQSATDANAEADGLGYPRECPLFYADDKNDPDVDQEIRFMNGAISVGGRDADMYSGGNVLAALGSKLSAYGGWCVETWYRGFGEDPCMEQLANTRDPIHIPGISDEMFDTDILYKSIPMWGPNGVVYIGGTKPSTTTGDDDMMYGTAAAEEKDGEAKYFKWYGEKLVEIPAIQVLQDHEAGVPFRGDCHPLEIVAMAQRVAKA